MIDQLLDAMPFRCIGPPRGGRVVAVAGHPRELAVFYFGAVAGGIWKTDDAGTTWQNVSDGCLGTSSVGALAVSESEPGVIYAGMGESTIRTDVSHGDGVYRSSDGGQSWVHMGLTDTRHISEIRIHPRDPDRVYVAALGHAFGPNPERGVYRSKDGGASWERVLGTGDRTGAADLAMDAHHPSILYASLWEAHRNFWELSSGGPGSGLWRSTDGGDTWTDLRSRLPLPASAVLGKIGVSASAARPGRVWALIESDQEPGLYRSEDFGKTWTLASGRQDLRYRPWYYMHVFADPQDEDTVYICNLQMWKSTDAGATFTKLSTPHGDNHDLWIDARDNRRMIQSNDGGANVSFNAGSSWSSIFNQLTAQLYTIDTDGRRPHYFVYGTQQDNSSIGVPSGANDGAITWADCRIAGTGESGYVAVKPGDPDVVYVGAIGSSPGGQGALQRYDHRTGQIRLVNVWPEHHGGMGAGELKYRFGWTYPIRFSPHDPEALYVGGNRVFRSRDEGDTWEAISPDLTRAANEKLGPSGGPITLDTSGAEHYCTLHTLEESPHEPGVIWAGSDDGLVHLTRDGGASWSDVTPPDLPEWAFIRTVEPSPHEAGTLYLAATRYKLDDTAPYIYKTCDYGESWQAITGSGEGAIPGHDFVRVVRADPRCAGVLYAGTETGLYVSLDDGASWRRWRSNFPVVPVYDLKVEGDELAIATHGRSFWILDDLTPLRRIAAQAATGDRSAFYSPERGFRWKPSSSQVTYGCPVPGCSNTFVGSRGGWDAHVASTRTHPDWYPGVADPVERKRLFKNDFSNWFGDDSDAGGNGSDGDGAALLFPPRPAWRLLPGVMDFITGTDGKDYTIGLGKEATYVATRNEAGLVERRFLDAGEAAPVGAVVYYYLPEGPATDAKADTETGTSTCSSSSATLRASLAFFDADGSLIREFHPKPAGYDKRSDVDKALDPGPWIPVRAGVNRFVWDLRHCAATRLRGNKTGEEAFRGPLVLPGACEVRLTVGERVRNETFEVVNDPKSPASLDELREQLQCLLEIRDKLSAAYAGVKRIRETGEDIARWCKRLAEEGHEKETHAGRRLRDALVEVESILILPGDQADSIGLNHRVRLNAALASVIGVVDAADARPPAAARALAGEYMVRMDAELERLDDLLTRDLTEFNRVVSEMGLSPIAAL